MRYADRKPRTQGRSGEQLRQTKTWMSGKDGEERKGEAQGVFCAIAGVRWLC